MQTIAETGPTTAHAYQIARVAVFECEAVDCNLVYKHSYLPERHYDYFRSIFVRTEETDCLQ